MAELSLDDVLNIIEDTHPTKRHVQSRGQVIELLCGRGLGQVFDRVC